MRVVIPRRARRSAAVLLAAASAAAAGVPASSSATIGIRVGIGDQQVAMFDNPAFQTAGFKRVRYFIPWDIMDNASERLTARAFVLRARASGISVLIHLSTNNYAIKKARLPSVATYKTQMRRIVNYFRAIGVREFGVWNEVNHASEPTWDTPSHAALYFVEMYRAVKGHCSSCVVVALDVLDQNGVERYMRDFYRRLSPTYRRRATVVGIHNYGDVNRQRTTFTRGMIQEAHKYNRSTKFWLTETGGIVNFGDSFPCDIQRAAARLSTMFSLANRYRTSGIQRLYIFSWSGTGCDARFDAGLTNPDGSTRPGYDYVVKKLPGYLR
jgi:hypothetical protein